MHIFAPQDSAVQEALAKVGISEDNFFTKDPLMGYNFVSKLISYDSCDIADEVMALDGSKINCVGTFTKKLLKCKYPIHFIFFQKFVTFHQPFPKLKAWIMMQFR